MILTLICRFCSLLEGESTAAVFAEFCCVAASAVDTMSQTDNMYVEETEEQRMRRNKKEEEEECLQMLIEANRENDFLIEARAAARARAAMEEVERQQRLQDLREIENDLAKLRKRKLLDHGVKHGWWVLSEKEKKEEEMKRGGKRSARMRRRRTRRRKRTRNRCLAKHTRSPNYGAWTRS